MDEIENLTGKLILAQPRSNDLHFNKSVVLVAQHNRTGAWGVVVNKPARTVTMQAIMTAAGVEYAGNEPIYVGGPVEPTRVHVIHSLDWFSLSTLKITENIGITGDLSVLAAIAQGQGPELYRAGVGLAVWTGGQLDGEMKGENPWRPENRWLSTDATVDLCLTGSGEEQWQRGIDQCISQRINQLF